ncbi:ion transporter [Arundinibacter roseus]|uniref:Ion transporter n=1 Tax=Arundinibacter roseus TaxID=2070510 RepID=A0A4V2X900_9BACT|nr:ion transporter [Arundinibacter roseus]TDB61875.1 ion transporter [Arundinibacter roseus]
MNTSTTPKNDWRSRLHEIIYEASTPAGKFFDVVLLWVILCSVILVMLESVVEINQEYKEIFNIAEWVITILFSIEYIARIVSVRQPWRYIFSFYGLIDFLSIIPKFLSLFFVGTQVLVALRALRLLRIFRILELHQYVGESQNLMQALKASQRKISVFVFAILVICVILGTVMYMVEGGDNGFTSIPRSIYWAIVTLTTVGYGDIAPQTTGGQIIASFIMILGYGIIAIPTGIVTSELSRKESSKESFSGQSCPNCSAEGHQARAKFCYRCGSSLE